MFVKYSEWKKMEKSGEYKKVGYNPKTKMVEIHKIEESRVHVEDDCLTINEHYRTTILELPRVLDEISDRICKGEKVNAFGNTIETLDDIVKIESDTREILEYMKEGNQLLKADYQKLKMYRGYIKEFLGE